MMSRAKLQSWRLPGSDKADIKLKLSLDVYLVPLFLGLVYFVKKILMQMNAQEAQKRTDTVIKAENNV